MTDRELFQQALDCLENAVDLQQSEIDMHILHYGEWYRPQRVEFMKKYLNKTNQSIEAIRARLAQPEREWVDLTNDEIDDIWAEFNDGYGIIEETLWGYERAIEAKLREKNG